MAIDAFLKLVKIDGSPLEGETNDAVCAGMIEISKCSLDAAQSLAGKAGLGGNAVAPADGGGEGHPDGEAPDADGGDSADKPLLVYADKSLYFNAYTFRRGVDGKVRAGRWDIDTDLLSDFQQQGRRMSRDHVLPGTDEHSLDSGRTSASPAGYGVPADFGTSDGARLPDEKGAMASDSFTIKISKTFDLSSRFLFLNYCQTAIKQIAPFKMATIYFRKAGFWQTGGPMKPEEASFLMAEFSKPYVVEYSIEAGKEGSIPKESIKLFFQNYRITYRWMDLDGTLQPPIIQGWNLMEDQEEW